MVELDGSVCAKGGGFDFEAVSGEDELVGAAPSGCTVSVKEGRNGFAVGLHDCAGL